MAFHLGYGLAEMLINIACALITSGMLYCGGDDFRPVDDIYDSYRSMNSHGGFEMARDTWSNQYGSGYTHDSPYGHTFERGDWAPGPGYRPYR